MKLHRHIKIALDATGLPWSLDRGGRHYKIVLNGRLIGIIPYGKGTENDRATRNIIAQIRRTVRQQGN